MGAVLAVGGGIVAVYGSAMAADKGKKYHRKRYRKNRITYHEGVAGAFDDENNMEVIAVRTNTFDRNNFAGHLDAETSTDTLDQSEEPDDDGRASLNGDEHMLADDDLPTQEEIERMNEETRIRNENLRKEHIKNMQLVRALLVCGTSLQSSTTYDHQSCTECTICIDEFEKSDACRSLPCKHVFHTECIDLWLKKNHTCPTCKQSVVSLSSPMDLRAAQETCDFNLRLKEQRQRVSTGTDLAQSALNARKRKPLRKIKTYEIATV
eukprot:m.161153 g.161153  ORF g.161153 m.161153 type:complete len:266 (+) comp18048_c0_seq2:290-1087(+)